MFALLLVLFLAGAPLLTKFLVGTFSPRSGASSSASLKTTIDQTTSSVKKETSNNNTKNTTVTPPVSTQKDAPLKVVQKSYTPSPIVEETVVEQVKEQVVEVVAQPEKEIVIEKISPIVEESVVEQVKEQVVVSTVEVVESVASVVEENDSNELVVEEPTVAAVVTETVVVAEQDDSNELVAEEPTVAVVEQDNSNEVVAEEPTVVSTTSVTESTPVVEETPVVATNTEEEGEFVSNLDVEKSSFVIKPSHISKYLIGQKGATINKIKDETQSRIDMSPIDDDSTLVTITANGEGFDLQKTYLKLRDELKGYGWEFDKNENQFVEHLTESMKLFKELEKKIQEQAQIMATSFDGAKKAFEEGDKGLASQLSNEGKHAQSMMKQYQEESANVMYTHLNKDRPETEIDLHGQYVDAAMNFLTQKIEKLRGQSISQMTIIYGAGNHSDASGPKIKPTVLKYLKENNITYEEQTQGSILANI